MTQSPPPTWGLLDSDDPFPSSRSAPRPAWSEPLDLPNVPGYELLEALGHGGMGVVYKARQLALNRLVAIKLLPNILHAEASTISRFLGEAQSVADVKHPNVVEVYDFGEVTVLVPPAYGKAARPVKVPYLVMEMLDGGHLGDRMEASPDRDIRGMAAMLAKVCRGVAAAHEAKIVHRDLKPGNILFTRGGEPKVVDFGLAKRAISNLTQSVAVMGTPFYMSPEQAKGKSKSVGPPTDVWALGVILYQCLTGCLPFTSDNQYSLLHQIITEEPEPPRIHNANLPPVLEAIVLKCLAKKPEDRFANAGELADALELFAAGSAVDNLIVARRAPVHTVSTFDWAMMLTMLLLLAMAGTCFVLWQQAEARNERPAATSK